jgi:hypothetical protein
MAELRIIAGRSIVFQGSYAERDHAEQGVEDSGQSETAS